MTTRAKIQLLYYAPLGYKALLVLRRQYRTSTGTPCVRRTSHFGSRLCVNCVIIKIHCQTTDPVLFDHDQHSKHSVYQSQIFFLHRLRILKDVMRTQTVFLLTASKSTDDNCHPLCFELYIWIQLPLYNTTKIETFSVPIH